MKYYKVLTSDDKGPYSEFDFTPYLPKAGRPGPWLPVVDDLEMCAKGWHCADADHILDWLQANIYEVEIRGETLKDEDNEKICAHEMRLVRRCEGWNERTARLFACDCAERVLPIFEKAYPADKRPRQCIETARKFANGKATQEQLNAARDAAWAAAWDAAGDAAWAAAGAAARAAAWDAAWAAAWAAAGDAAGAAARAAAWAAAGAAAGAAARAAARAAERKWQTKQLLKLLK